MLLHLSNGNIYCYLVQLCVQYSFLSSKAVGYFRHGCSFSTKPSSFYVPFIMYMDSNFHSALAILVRYTRWTYLIGPITVEHITKLDPYLFFDATGCPAIWILLIVLVLYSMRWWSWRWTLHMVPQVNFLTHSFWILYAVKLFLFQEMMRPNCFRSICTNVIFTGSNPHIVIKRYELTLI